MTVVSRSKYFFPREEPTAVDWEVWSRCLGSMTVGNHELPTPLGGWITESHRKWEWILNEEDKVLYRRV